MLREIGDQIRHRLEWRQKERPFRGELVTEPRLAFSLPARPNFLFLRQRAMGDTLVAVPVIRAVRRRFPTARIQVMLERRNYGVREALRPWVDRVWCYEQTPVSFLRLAWAFRRERFDVIVDLRDWASVTSSYFVRASGCRQSLATQTATASAYTHCVTQLDPGKVHVVERFAHLLLPFGIDPETEPLDLEYRLSEPEIVAARGRLRPTDKPLRLGVNLSGRGHYKYWGRANFAAFARWVGERFPDIDVTICSEPQYAAEAVAIAAEAGAGLVPPLSFHEFAAVIHEFDLLLTPDTSVLHLAAAWKIPTIALFRPNMPGLLPWTPYRTPHRALSHFETAERIPLPEVQQALVSLLAECFPGTAAGRGAMTR